MASTSTYIDSNISDTNKLELLKNLEENSIDFDDQIKFHNVNEYGDLFELQEDNLDWGFNDRDEEWRRRLFSEGTDLLFLNDKI